MTDHDKAIERDQIADYLRKNGWTVRGEFRDPYDGTVHESWIFGDVYEGSAHSLMSAFTIECFKDAPRQGERLASSLRQIIEDKPSLGRVRPKETT